MAYPRFDRAETIERIRSSLETVAWGARLVPEGFTHGAPPGAPPDFWTVAMNLAHLVVYDEGIANPILDSLARGEDGMTMVRTDNENWFYNDAVALSPEPIEGLLARLTAARSQQAELIASIPASRWNDRCSPAFGGGSHGTGPHSPAWIATKTFQHTWEHGNAVLRAALFSPHE